MGSFAFLNLDSLNARSGPTCGGGGTHHQHRGFWQQPTVRGDDDGAHMHASPTGSHLQGTAASPTVPANVTAPRRSTRRQRNVAPARTVAASMAAPFSAMVPDLDMLSWKDGWSQLKQMGNAHYAHANYAAAIDAYMRALDVVHANIPYGDVDDVTDARVLLHNNIAAAFLELGMFNLALREAEMACQLDCSNVKAILRRGKALYGLGDVITAELMFRRVLEVATVGYTSERSDALNFLTAMGGASATHIVSEVDTQSVGSTTSMS